MRLIHEMVRTFLKLIFGIDGDPQEEIRFENSDTAERLKKLKAMADMGEINEAENLMYEELEDGKPEDLKMAVLFYDYLNEKTSEFLERYDYSREEIADGMKQVIRQYGYGGLADTLIETP